MQKDARRKWTRWAKIFAGAVIVAAVGYRFKHDFGRLGKG
jgi:hypothetical protein